MQAKFLGGMIGSGLGDAIGELAFRHRDETALHTALAQVNVLTYTDDTAMAIGLAESLAATGMIDEQHVGDCFLRNYKREPWRGYASGPPTVFSLVEQRGLSYRQAAARLFGGAGSFGNGAAMRIAPVGLFFYNAPDLYAQAEASAAVAHAHPVGIDGAAVLAKAIAQVVHWTPDEPFPWQQLLQELIAFARTREIQNQLQLAGEMLTHGVAPETAVTRLGYGIEVQASTPFALYAFLRHAASFEHCLLCAVTHGGDRDTLGAMAGALSGAYLGVEAIPVAWRAKLENHDYIEQLARTLAEMALPSPSEAAVSSG